MPLIILTCISFLLASLSFYSSARACDPVIYDGRTTSFAVNPDFNTTSNCLHLTEEDMSQGILDSITFESHCDEGVLVEIQDCTANFPCTETLEKGDSFTFHNPISFSHTAQEARSATLTLEWSTSTASGYMTYETDYKPLEESRRGGRGCRPIGQPLCTTLSITPQRPALPCTLVVVFTMFSLCLIRRHSRDA